jgi:hypothetical protein
MNWASLLLAVLLGTPAAVMLLRHKAPRATAIMFALAAVCLLAGVPSLLATLGHPIGPGPILLGVVVVAIVSAMFFYFDVIRGEHGKPLRGRKGGGAPGQPGQPGAAGGKHNHHVRPLAASLGLVVTGLLIALNWSAVISGTGHGFTQTVNTITRQQSS